MSSDGEIGAEEHRPPTGIGEFTHDLAAAAFIAAVDHDRRTLRREVSRDRFADTGCTPRLRARFPDSSRSTDASPIGQL